MNEFELRLESELLRLLDPVAARPVPVRRTRVAPRRADATRLLELAPRPVSVAPAEMFS